MGRATVANEKSNSFLFSLVAQDIYSTGYRMMLFVFYIFNWDTECRMMGRSVRQRFVKPKKKQTNEAGA